MRPLNLNSCLALVLASALFGTGDANANGCFGVDARDIRVGLIAEYRCCPSKTKGSYLNCSYVKHFDAISKAQEEAIKAALGPVLEEAGKSAAQIPSSLLRSKLHSPQLFNNKIELPKSVVRRGKVRHPIFLLGILAGSLAP